MTGTADSNLNGNPVSSEMIEAGFEFVLQKDIREQKRLKTEQQRTIAVPV